MALSVLIGQVGSVLAAPALQESDRLAGIVKSITLETDPNTGITTVTVEIKGADQTKQTFRISQETAVKVGLVALDGDGNLVINKSVLGKPIEIDPAMVLPDQPEDRHPVGDALATFFFDSLGVGNDELYEAIMKAHNEGIGFGVIAQALWLTKELEGNSEIFEKLLTAKETGDYSEFIFGGVAPKNWGQLRKAILDGKKVDKPGNTVSNQNNQNNKNKDKNKNKGDSGNNDKSGSGDGPDRGKDN